MGALGFLDFVSRLMSRHLFGVGIMLTSLDEYGLAIFNPSPDPDPNPNPNPNPSPSPSPSPNPNQV